MKATSASSGYRLKTKIKQQLDSVGGKFYQLSVKCGLAQALYFAEAPFWAWLCNQPWVQQHYGSTEVALLQRFLTATQLLKANTAISPSQVTQQVLFGLYWSKRWPQRMQSWPWQHLAQVISTQGEEHWRAAYRQGKGVILVQQHAVATVLLRAWLTHAEAKPFMIMEKAFTIAKAMGLVYSPATVPFINAQQLQAAQACLAEGGVVRILPDGFNGSAKQITLTLYQHQRSFRTSFAELALLTGAIVIPMAPVLDLTGRVTFTFYPPLDTGDSNLSHAQRLEHLMKQYVAFLQTSWLDAPSQVMPEFMARFLEHATPIA